MFDVLLYWVQRDALAQYIKEQLNKDFEDAKCLYGLKQWFNSMVEKNKEQVIKTVLSFDRSKSYINHVPCGYSIDIDNAHNISVFATTDAEVKL